MIQARTRWPAPPKVLVLSIAAPALACSPHPIETPGVLPAGWRLAGVKEDRLLYLRRDGR